MKRLTLLVCCLLLVAATVSTQAQDAPMLVQNSFKAKYPNVEVKDWDWEDEIDLYEAEFKLNNKEYEAYFKPDGTWVKTKRELKKDELPALVTASIGRGEYSTWNLGDRYEVDTPEGKWYKVKAENKGQTMYLKFSENGEMIKAMSKEEKKMDKKRAQ